MKVFLLFAVFTCGLSAGLFIVAFVKRIFDLFGDKNPSDSVADGSNDKKTMSEEELKALEHEKDLDKQFNRLMNYNGGREKKK